MSGISEAAAAAAAAAAAEAEAAATRARAAAPTQNFRAPGSPRQQYKFTGTLNDPDEPHQQLSFYVMAGVGGATPTGGWAQITTIDRPRRLGFTMPTGFAPYSMDIPVRFDATVQYSTGGFSEKQLEINIQMLEWMAGRGKLYANGTHPARGNPPIVQVASYPAGSDTATNLIPPNFHSEGANDIRWMISNLQYDPSPIRGYLGDRRQQDVTVSVTQYVAVPGAPSSPRVRQQGRAGTGANTTYTTTSAVDTIQKICVRHGITRAQDWTTVVAFNQSTLKVRSYTKSLKPGTKVLVPASVFPVYGGAAASAVA